MAFLQCGLGQSFICAFLLLVIKLARTLTSIRNKTHTSIVGTKTVATIVRRQRTIILILTSVLVLLLCGNSTELFGRWGFCRAPWGWILPAPNKQNPKRSSCDTE